MTAVAYETALEAVRARLSARSAAHSEAVGEAAASLAEEYGADVESARLAGLLHDWCRDEDREDLLARAGELGVAVEAVDAAVPYLLHARLGAAAVRERFPGIDDVVLQAIERHTLGAVEMSDVDMCVYIADMIEPARRFDGVAELRQSVGLVPLDELYARAYAMSLVYLVSMRKHIHPMTVEAWNAVVDRVRS